MGESVAGEGERARRLSRTQVVWAVLVASLLAHAVLAAFLFDPKPFVGGDNASYMILAESIESGQGYRDLFHPDSPRNSEFPPFYPTLLALAGLFGGGLFAFKVLSALFTTTSVLFLFLLGRRRLGDEGGLAIAAAFAFNPVLLYYSHWVLTEAPFVLLMLIALWAAERLTVSQRSVAVVAVAAIIGFLTDAAGLTLVLAVLVALGWRRRGKDLAAIASAAFVVVGGWWLWGWLNAAQAADIYPGNFLLLDPYDPGAGYVGPGALVARLVNNMRVYAVDVLPETLSGVGPGGGVNIIAIMLALILIALALVALVRGIRKAFILELYAVFYAVLIIAYPQVWANRAALLPLLPLILLLAASGVVWCFEFVRTRQPTWVLPAIGVVLVLLTVPDNVRRIVFNQRCMAFYRQGDDLSCYPPPWRAFALSGEWVRHNSFADAVVVSSEPRLYYLFSERVGRKIPSTVNDGEMLAFFDEIGADYVTADAVSPATSRYLIPVLRSRNEFFQIVHSVGEGATAAYVLRYDETGTSGIADEGGG
jgi:hypothetical protein